MKFDDLDTRMRVFETAHDMPALPGVYMVARVDGRSFTRLTKVRHKFDAPYDERFRDLMIGTTEHLMNCGFPVVYGYTQSDEISLLFALRDDSFGRKLRKFNSILAGEASAKFSVLLQDTACFDCRISELPRAKDVVDYFRWRSQDAHRNALNGHCYWILRRDGKSDQEATDYLDGMSVAQRHDLMFAHGLNFNNLPAWQKRGVGLYWEEYHKASVNRKTGESVQATRRRIRCDMELPVKDAYDKFLEDLVAKAGV